MCDDKYICRGKIDFDFKNYYIRSKETYMSHYYVYAYLNPLECGVYNSSIVSFLAKPFYVGKGIGNRLYDHLKEARPTRKYKHSHKLNTIRLIQRSELNPIILKISEELSEDEALCVELKLILELKQNYGLTNIRTNNWISTKKVNLQKKLRHNNPRKDTITIYNKLLGEHSIINLHQLSLYQQVFGDDNIINVSEIKFKVGEKTQMSRNGETNGMFGKSANGGKKWCIIEGEEKFLSSCEIEGLIQSDITVVYGRLYKPSGKRIIFEGELKGKYRNNEDISNNPNKKYQYGLIWNITKPTFLNHNQI